MYRRVGFSNSRVNFPCKVVHPTVPDSRMFVLALAPQTSPALAERLILTSEVP
jgi:hypothetical protein